MRVAAGQSLGGLWRRRWFLWFGRSPLGAFAPATDIDHRAVPALYFGIHPAQNEDATVEENDFPVLCVSCPGVGWPDVGFSARPALEAQLGWRRLVGKMHHDAAIGSKRNDIRLLALSGRRCLRARAVLFLMIGRESPTSDNILRWKGRRQRRANRGSARLLKLRARRASG